MLWTIEPKLPFDRRVALVAEAGYSAVELVGEWEGWSASDLAANRALLSRLGLSVDACSGIRASLVDPAERDALLAQVRAQLPVMAELGCSRLILLTGNVVPGISREAMRAHCVESLHRVADLLAPHQITILLENIDPEENPRYFLTSSAEGFDIVRQIANPRVKFLYDFFHEQIAEGNLIAKLEKNLPLLALVHVADVPGRHEPGTGEINYLQIYRRLGQLGYTGGIAMEFLPTGAPVPALRAARLAAEKAYAEGRAASARFATETPYAIA